MLSQITFFQILSAGHNFCDTIIIAIIEQKALSEGIIEISALCMPIKRSYVAQLRLFVSSKRRAAYKYRLTTPIALMLACVYVCTCVWINYWKSWNGIKRDSTVIIQGEMIKGAVSLNLVKSVSHIHIHLITHKTTRVCDMQICA